MIRLISNYFGVYLDPAIAVWPAILNNISGCFASARVSFRAFDLICYGCPRTIKLFSGLVMGFLFAWSSLFAALVGGVQSQNVITFQ
jgi:hypothetical protein